MALQAEASITKIIIQITVNRQKKCLRRRKYVFVGVLMTRTKYNMIAIQDLMPILHRELLIVR